MMNKLRKSYTIVNVIFLLLITSCHEKYSNKIVKDKKDTVNIKNINFPLDVLFGKGHLYNLDKPEQKIAVNSGYYNTIPDIFKNGKHFSKSEKLTKYKVFYDENDGDIGIYDKYLYDLSGDYCGDCLPLFSCYYFDGRYAVLTEENKYQRIIIDAKEELIFLINYTDKAPNQIKDLVFLNNDLNPYLWVKQNQNNIEYFQIENSNAAELPYLKNEKSIQKLSYNDILSINRQLMNKDFKATRTRIISFPTELFP